MRLLFALLAYLVFPVPAMAGNTEIAVPVDSSMSELYVSAQSADAQQTRTTDNKPIDPVYLELARATGGQVLAIDPKSMGTSAGQQILQQVISGNNGRENVLMMEKNLDGTGVPFAASLVRPDGSVVKVSEAGVITNQTGNGQMWTIARPVAGEWKLRLSGSGTISVAATAKTPVFLFGARYMRLGGDGVHMGYFPDENQNPPAGSRRMIEFNASDDANQLQDVHFLILKPDGTQLAGISEGASHNSGQDDYGYTVIVPDQPYRFALMAKDSGENSVQRTYPALFGLR